MPLQTSTLRCGDTATITVSGELDIATAPIVTHAMVQAELEKYQRCVLDLRELTFIDCRGVRLLSQLAAAARGDGCALLVIPPPDGAAARMMRLQGAHLWLTYITEALQPVPPPVQMALPTELQG